MAFRRQDIPKTSRKGDDGVGRTIFPRYLRDKALLPSIKLALEYLEGMVGRKRGDCSPETLLELFGDAKLARCLLACMSERYRYRSLDFVDALGAEQAAALLDWGIATPADLRAYLYLTVNQTRDGFAAGEERVALLTDTADVLGVTPEQLDMLIHLDAERNAILIRTGPIPEPEEIVARYNALLTISVLRHASVITFDELDVSEETIDAICARHEVNGRQSPDGTLRLPGRKSALGSWTPFGGRLARCAAHLVMASGKEPSGSAIVHLGEQRYEFRLDHKSMAPLRPKRRVVAAPAEIAACGKLADQLSAYRRETDELGGWTIRRWPGPVVTADAIFLPEFAFDRGDAAVPVVPIASAGARDGLLAALATGHPVIGVSEREGGDDRSVTGYREEAVVAALGTAAATLPAPRTPHGMLDEELASQGWLRDERLAHLLQRPDDLAAAVVPLATGGRRVYIAGFGLCETALLNDLQAMLGTGPVDLAAYRQAVVARIGEPPGIDTLIVHLLTRGATISSVQPAHEHAA